MLVLDIGKVEKALEKLPAVEDIPPSLAVRFFKCLETWNFDTLTADEIAQVICDENSITVFENITDGCDELLKNASKKKTTIKRKRLL